jgi:hypothetical protein
MKQNKIIIDLISFLNHSSGFLKEMRIKGPLVQSF